MEIEMNNPMFQEYFASYNKQYEQLRELTDDDLPRLLKSFNIRFRLSLGMQIYHIPRLTALRKPMA
jgi:hypothetical protein